MDNLYHEIMGEIQAHEQGDSVNGLFVTIDGFDYCASFSDDDGYQLLNSHEAQQLLELDNDSDYEKLAEYVRELNNEWNDILMSDYQMRMSLKREYDKNYHGMADKHNWV